MNGAIVGFIAASLFFGLVMRRSKAAPPGGPDPDLDRPLVLRHGRPMVTLGWVSVAVVPAVITLIVLFAPLDDVHRARGAFLNVLILGLGLYVLLEALRFEVRVGPDGLAHRSAWSGRLALRWDEVERVAFSRFNMWFVVHAAGGRTRRVSLMVPGVVGFLAACERHLPPGPCAARSKATGFWGGRSPPERMTSGPRSRPPDGVGAPPRACAASSIRP